MHMNALKIKYVEWKNWGITEIFKCIWESVCVCVQYTLGERVVRRHYCVKIEMHGLYVVHLCSFCVWVEMLFFILKYCLNVGWHIYCTTIYNVRYTEFERELYGTHIDIFYAEFSKFSKIDFLIIHAIFTACFVT